MQRSQNNGFPANTRSTDIQVDASMDILRIQRGPVTPNNSIRDISHRETFGRINNISSQEMKAQTYTRISSPSSSSPESPLVGHARHSPRSTQHPSRSPDDSSDTHLHAADIELRTLQSPPSSPPPLPRQRTIQLPRQYPDGILLNPILTRRALGQSAAINWNLSQSIATATVKSFGTDGSWASQPATIPPTPAATLRIEGLERPIIVHSSSEVLTIVEVLMAVDQATDSWPVRCRALEGLQWGGLYDSPEEVEVWLVDLRGRWRPHRGPGWS